MSAEALAAAAPSWPGYIPVTDPRVMAPPAAPNILGGISRGSSNSTITLPASRSISPGETPPISVYPVSPAAPNILQQAPPIRTLAVDNQIKRIDTRFSTLFTLTGDAMRELKIAGARTLEAKVQQKTVGGICASLSRPVNLTIMFIRHSESCANVLKRNTMFGGLAQTAYTDPELSERGVQMAEERARNLTPTTLKMISTEPWIVGCSTLFRAQQTALYLSDGIRDERTSDRVVVLPYIQEIGGGQENVAMSETERLKSGLYEKLPGGRASHDRIVTTLFDAAPDASQPSVDGFFKWLGCNLALVYTAGAVAAAPPTDIRIIIVTHSNFMTDLYKKFRDPIQPPSVKYDNLEAMVVSLGYAPNGSLLGKPRIIRIKDEYRPSMAIKSSCPDNVCRKPVCPKDAIPAKTMANNIHPYADTCARLNSIKSKSTGPITKEIYNRQIKPVIQSLAVSDRPQVKTVRKLLTAYEPPNALVSMFSRQKFSDQLGRNIIKAKYELQCPEAEKTGVLLNGGPINPPLYKSMAGGALSRKSRKSRTIRKHKRNTQKRGQK
jgi:broad specificity phosphatase PhoE